MAGPTGQPPRNPYPQQPYGYPGPGGRPGHGPGPYGPPQYAAGPPPRPPVRRSSAGKIVAIVLGVVLVLVVLAGIGIYFFVSSVTNSVAGLTGGAGTTCDGVSTADVDASLGGSYEVVQLGGLGDLAGAALDSRVLADAPSCWAVETGDGGRLARIARYSGGDAAARFAAEKTAAMGTSEDRGNGLSVSTEGYFAGDTAAGDEAFCTSGDFIGSAGALVRRGDLLVYVSTTAAGGGAAAVPDIEFDADQLSFGTDEANCALAVTLAGKVT